MLEIGSFKLSICFINALTIEILGNFSKFEFLKSKCMTLPTNLHRT